MPLLEGFRGPSQSVGAGRPPQRRQSHQFSDLAIAAMTSQGMSSAQSSPTTAQHGSDPSHSALNPRTQPTVLDPHAQQATLMPPPKTLFGRSITPSGPAKPLPYNVHSHYAFGAALTDTPMPSQPGSPQM
jgi:hypothetical protein